jgi:uncharacterized protein (DUF305 family)
MDRTGDAMPDLSFDQLMELERRAAERERAEAEEAEAADAEAADGGAGSPTTGDVEVVLPWWQHPINIGTIVVTTAIVFALIGWMIGVGGGRTAHNEVDTGFLHDMRAHHEQAVLMSFLYLAEDQNDDGLRIIAASILRGQNIEIGRMIQLLRDFGEPESNEDGAAMNWMGMSASIDQMPGMASDAELDELNELAGPEADRLFVELMVAHHEGGIEMAEFAADRAESDEVRKMAAGMARAQRGEIRELMGELDG